MFISSVNNFLFGRDRVFSMVSLRGNWKYFFSALLVRLTGTFLAFASTWLLLPLLSALPLHQDFFLPGTSPIFRSLLESSDRFKVFPESFYILRVALLLLLEIFFYYLTQIFKIKHNKFLNYQLKSQGLTLLCQADFNFFIKNTPEDILYKINREVARVAIALVSFQNTVVITFSSAVFYLGLCFISLPLTLVTTLILILAIFSEKLILSYSKKQTTLLRQKSQTYHRRIVELPLGIYQIKQSTTETQEYQQITQLIREKQQVEFKTQAIAALIYPLERIIALILVLALILTSYYLGDRQFLTNYSILLIYILLLLRFISLIKQLNQAYLQYNKHQTSIKILNKFLEHLGKLQITGGKVIFSEFNTAIEFQDVTFAYPYHGQIILERINFQLFPQETLAIVGTSGAGKSSLVNLLPRFYEPISGRILINNCPLKDYDLKSLRQGIVIINQDTFIFSDSLLYNLTYGITNVSEAEVMAAAKITKLDRLINQLPQGLLTPVGDLSDRFPESWKVTTADKLTREIFLNPEQKQLLAITRAILRQPKIVILDQVTANLEPATCQIVQEAIAHLCRDRTAIIITDRLETIKQANRIIVLHKGKIIESGNHQSLLKTGKSYKRLYLEQFKTSRQSPQQQLAKRIADKLASQNNHNLSFEIRNNLNTLLNYLQLINEGLVEDEQEQEKILDESYQSAKNMLASLREYERKLARGIKKTD